MKHKLGMAGFKGKPHVALMAVVMMGAHLTLAAQTRTRPAPDAVVLAPSVHANASASASTPQTGRILEDG